MSSLTDQIQQIAADVFDEPIASIALESTPNTVANWDSLTHLNLVMAIEQRFGCEITPDESERMKSIGDVVGIVETKTGGR